MTPQSTRPARKSLKRAPGAAARGRVPDEPVGPLSDKAIVRAARDIIAEVGVPGLTMRRLSSTLGVALGATYHHVPTKHDLLVLVGRDLYGEVTSPAPTGSWDAKLKKLMLNMSSVVASYPGMAGFMMANADELVPTELNQMVRGILREAGFSDRGSAAVLGALFFYVTGMNAGGISETNSRLYNGRSLQARFEDGLDILLAGAQVRLGEEKKRKRARAR
ncbi:MAG: TetR/AcrR family transcriptional regulator [Acidimicrobiales bacterium]